MPSSLTIDAAFRAGIRSDWRIDKNVQVLVDGQGLRVTEHGLKDVLPISDLSVVMTLPTSGSPPSPVLVDAWPYPELLRGTKNTFFVGKTSGGSEKLYVVSETSIPWTATESEPYPYDNWGGTQGSIYLAAQPLLVEAAGNVMIFTGDAVVFNAPQAPNSHKLFRSVSDDLKSKVTINCGCGFRNNRVIFGGFDPAHLYTIADWPAYLASSGRASQRTGDIPFWPSSASAFGKMDKNWVWWSSIGAKDARWLFSLDEMMYGTHPSFGSPISNSWGYNRPWVFELWRRQETGAREMPWRGWVERILSIGQEAGLVVYGEDGIAGLVPASAAGSKTFQFVDIVGLGKGYGVGERAMPNQAGSGGRSCVCGDWQDHIFIGEDGVLWGIDAQFKASKISDAKLFDPARWSDPSKILISKDPVQNEYHIVYKDTGNSGIVESYLLNRHGIMRSNDAPTSISCYSNGRIGHLSTGSPAIAYSRNFLTNEFDGGVDDVWIVSGLRINDSLWTLYVDYKEDRNDASFTRTSSLTPDSRGVVAGIQIQGTSFRVYGVNTQVDSHGNPVSITAERLDVEIRRAGSEDKMSLRFLLPA